MCGIGGIWIKNGGKIDEWMSVKVVSLHMNLISRGTDAMGYYARSETKSELIKLPVDAVTFYNEISEKIPSYEYFKGFDFVGLHTRLATQGDPSQNLNNHPFELKRIVGAHNGYLVTDLPIEISKNEPETDSYQIFKIIDRRTEKAKDRDDFAIILADILEMVSEHGYFAIWIYDKATDTLYLARDRDKPLYYAETEDFIVFASESHHIVDAFGKKAFKVIKQLKSGEIYVISRNGIEDTIPFEIRPMVYNYTDYYYDYYYYGKKCKSFKRFFL